MKRICFLAAILISGAANAIAQTDTVTASHLQDGSAAANGSICWTPVLSDGTKIPLATAWSTPSSLTSVCHDVNGNLTDASCPSGAFSGGFGASYQDVTEIAAPSNPASGNDRLYLNSSTHLLACLSSSGANCMPSGSIPGGVLGSVPYQSAPGVTAVSAANTSSSTLCFTETGTGTVGAIPTWGSCAGSAATAFSAITGSTNTSAAMVVGTGSSIDFAGTGTIDANLVNGAVVPASAGFTATNSSRQIIAAAYTPTNASVVPSTAPSAGQILVGNAGGTAYAPVSMSGDGTLASTGAITVTKTSGAAFTGLATLAGSAAGDVPYYNGSIFYDYNLTQPAPNPINTDANGNFQSVTLTNGDACALTFTQPSSNTATITLKIIQSSTSTFNGTISGCKWPGGSVPTITATSGAVDVITVREDGTNAYCTIAQAFS